MIKKINNKVGLTICGLLFLCTLVFFLWVKNRPVEIIAVYGGGDILIKNPPITDKGKISWWKENEYYIKENYGIPKLKNNKTFSVTIWDFGDGYEIYREGSHFETPTPELYCFDDSKKNCLDKRNKIVTIYKTSSGVIKFVTNETTYYQKENGEVVKSG